MNKLILAALAAATMLPGVAAAPAFAQHSRDQYDNDRHDNGRHRGWDKQDQRDAWRQGRQYDYNRPDNRYGGYDASRYYRDGRYYQERRLGRNDRIYRGGDGRYYCRRSDGSTGLIIGAIGGGVLGNSIANGGSNTLGTLLGAGLGAALGNSIDRGNVRCR